MEIVLLESPFHVVGSKEKTYENITYARRAMAHSLSLGELPIVTHLLYNQVLDDYKENEIKVGSKTGKTFYDVVSKIVVYFDKGLSSAMLNSINKACDKGIRIEYRTLDNFKDKVITNDLFLNDFYE